jgi:2,3-dihydroxy-p-cumate/2,3-dihydroxybenzoate 3,4-dioxygenase
MARYSRLGYVALNVTDIERSVDFYERLLGLQLVGRGADGEAYFRCGDDHHNVVLYRAAAAGLKRIGFQMESEAELAVLRRRVEGSGLRPIDVDPAECARLYQGATMRVSEPHSGITLEFYGTTRPFEHAAFTPTVAKIERLGHIVVRSPDIERSSAVAQEAFNFRCSDTIVGMAHFLRCFPNQFHHSLAFTRGERSGLNHVNFMVTEIDDIGKAIHRLRKHDVPIVYGPGRHVPSESIFLYFLDPDGLTLEYSFGMETFEEEGARDPRALPPVRASFDYWDCVRDPRMGAVGAVERL